MRKWEGWVVLSQEKLEFRMISASVSPFREQDGLTLISPLMLTTALDP